MKRIIHVLTIILLLLAQSAAAEVRPEYSGAWYNPAQTGHGFSIEVISSQRSIVFWYVYDMNGSPIFLLVDGVNVGNRIEGKVYYFEGMIWGSFNPDDNQRQDWGTATITFNNCDEATLEYDSIMPNFTPGGTSNLVRLIGVAGFGCADHRLAGLYEGILRSRIFTGAYAEVTAVLDQFGYLSIIEDEEMMHYGYSADVPSSDKGTMTFVGVSAFISDDGSYETYPWESQATFDRDGIKLIIDSPASLDSVEVWLYHAQYGTHTPAPVSSMEGWWSVAGYYPDRLKAVYVDAQGNIDFGTEGCFKGAYFYNYTPAMSIVHLWTQPGPECPYDEEMVLDGAMRDGQIEFAGYEPNGTPRIMLFERAD